MSVTDFQTVLAETGSESTKKTHRVSHVFWFVFTHRAVDIACQPTYLGGPLLHVPLLITKGYLLTGYKSSSKSCGQRWD